MDQESVGLKLKHVLVYFFFSELRLIKPLTMVSFQPLALFAAFTNLK